MKNNAIETIINDNQAPIEKSRKSLNNKFIEEVLEKLNTIDMKIGNEQDKDVSP